ncbi:MAG TPA: hypothetical protein VLK03_08030 [Nocardioides sp.]|nr:hypothetical protein [Nocardioides sp.]
MIRTTTLSAAALLGLTLLAPTGAGAAATGCQGGTATIVGSAGQPVTGTEGADIIVTAGASRVNALGGNDLICVTGDPSAVPEDVRTVVVSAGAGNDRVEATTPGWGTLTTLDAGDDSYLGATGADQEIRTEESLSFTDTGVDTVRVTSGVATVYTGAPSRSSSDVVEIDSGMVQWTGLMTPEGRLTGGPASTLRTYARSGDAVIDAAAGTAVTETSSATFSGFGQLEYATSAYKGTVTFRGTDDADWFSVEARDTYNRVVDLRGGRDFYSSDGFGNGRSSYDGGAGRDQLLLATPRQDVAADLDEGRFVGRQGRRTVRRTFVDFEDLALSARTAKVDGSARGEEIALRACRADVSADAGPDRVHLDILLIGWDNPGCPSRRGSVDGGRGDDVLTGSPGRDRIVGGPGTDVANGGAGRDTCVAEKRTSCAVPR